MRQHLGLAAVLFLSFSPTVPAQPVARDLTFEERVKAQEAIERVYYSHQIGATRPFEAAVQGGVLEGKVRTYLKQSAALQQVWHTPITAEMVEAELNRMSQRTRMPGRLKELFDSLNNDAFLIQECLARPALTDRMIRGFFAFDQQIHEKSREEAEKLRRALSTDSIDLRAAHPRRSVVHLSRTETVRTPGNLEAEINAGPATGPVDTIELDAEEYVRWEGRLPQNMLDIGPVEEVADAFMVRVVLDRQPDRLTVAVYVFEKETWNHWWAREQRGFDATVAVPVAVEGLKLTDPLTSTAHVWTGAQDCALSAVDRSGDVLQCPDDTWEAGPLDDRPPTARHDAAAIWTGSLMIIWGGSGFDGRRYDPATDTWSPMADPNVPVYSKFSIVWAGNWMIVWGGTDNHFPTPRFFNSGAKYDPLTDTWATTSSPDSILPGRIGHSAIWTGTEMIVWGGYFTSSSQTIYLQDGGRYNPYNDTWTYIPSFSPGVPAPRAFHTAVWADDLMIIWGGMNGTGRLNTGASVVSLK